MLDKATCNSYQTDVMTLLGVQLYYLAVRIVNCAGAQREGRVARCRVGDKMVSRAGSEERRLWTCSGH